MNSGGTAGIRIARLLRLLLAVRGDGCPNARVLAEACEVSRRTIYRDLELLAMAGVPVQYQADRLGYALPPTYAFEAPCLDATEAAAILVLARQSWPGDSLGLARAARAGARKLLLALPAEIRARVKGLVELAGEVDDPPPPAPERQAVFDALTRSLAERVQLRLWYDGGPGAAAESTKVSPYRLLCERADWRLIGRSSADRAVRSFAVPRIRRAVPTGDSYEIPPRFDTGRLAVAAACRREVRLRFWEPASADALDAPPGRVLEVQEPEDGAAVVRLEVEGLDEALRWIIGFGDRVEVLYPPELRERLRDLAARVARAHAPAPPHDAARDREPAGARMGRVGG